MRAFIRFINSATRVYLATPPAYRWVFWLLPVIYFIWPIDLVPDLLPGLGRVDDLVLVGFAFWTFDRAKLLKDFFKEVFRAVRNGRSFDGNTRGNFGNKPPHVVLGVAKKASPQEVKKAYRQLLRRYHPDKFAHMGKEYEGAAREKTRAIIEAYEAMMAK